MQLVINKFDKNLVDTDAYLFCNKIVIRSDNNTKCISNNKQISDSCAIIMESVLAVADKHTSDNPSNNYYTFMNHANHKNLIKNNGQDTISIGFYGEPKAPAYLSKAISFYSRLLLFPFSVSWSESRRSYELVHFNIFQKVLQDSYL